MEKKAENSQDLKLMTVDGKLTLSGVSVDFDDVDMRLIKKSAHNTNQPVVKAIGKTSKQVIDLTCGYGRDAYLLLCTGRQLIGVERNALIYELLKDGVSRAMENPEHQEIFKNFQLVHESALHFVENLQEAAFPDAYYIDPMYPPRNSSALPRKEIQVLRRLLVDELNSDIVVRETQLRHLIDLCLEKTKKRVVLKRPNWLEPLFPPKVSFGGKLVRYDVYVR